MKYKFNWHLLSFLAATAFFMLYLGVLIGSYFNDAQDVSEVLLASTAVISAFAGGFLTYITMKEADHEC